MNTKGEGVLKCIPFIKMSHVELFSRRHSVAHPTPPLLPSLLVPSAPSPPVSATSRRSINVTWSPPANPNGILLFYQLEYSIVGQSSMTLDVPAESLAASLVELTPAQVYQVTVRASTSVGFGSSSEPVRTTTEMDSECDCSTPHPQHRTVHTTPTHRTVHTTPTTHNIPLHTHNTHIHSTPHTQHSTPTHNIPLHTTTTHTNQPTHTTLQHHTPTLTHNTNVSTV